VTAAAKLAIEIVGTHVQAFGSLAADQSGIHGEFAHMYSNSGLLALTPR